MRELTHDTTVNVRLSTDMLEELKVYAQDHEQRTVSDVVRRLISDAISKSESK